MSQDTIAIHWEVAAPRDPHERCAQQWEEIRAYHRRTGYSDIAYSFGACQHGGIFLGRGWSRQSAATCNNHWNARSWSVCWMGGPGFTPTEKALSAIRSVVDDARGRGARNIIGHRQACATQCPGDFLMDWIARGLPVSGEPAPPPSPKKGQSVMLIEHKKTYHLLGVGMWRYPNPTQAGELEKVFPLIRAKNDLELAARYQQMGCWDYKKNKPIPRTRQPGE